MNCYFILNEAHLRIDEKIEEKLAKLKKKGFVFLFSACFLSDDSC
jgi:hypothetical protein